YKKSIVLIFAYDPDFGTLHTTTYGTDPQNKAWAAQGGEIGTKALGGLREQATEYEDYRLSLARSLLKSLILIRSLIGTRLQVVTSSPEDAKSAENVIYGLDVLIQTAKEYL